MAKVVLGLGVSHSPHQLIDTSLWASRGADDMRSAALVTDDGRVVNYSTLLRERGPIYVDAATDETFARQGQAMTAAMRRLSEEIVNAKPDIVLIIGDDHEELFPITNIPSIAVYYGDEIVMRDLAGEDGEPAWMAGQSWMADAVKGSAMDAAHRFRGSGDFARKLIEGLLDRDVDVGGVGAIPDAKHAGIGHSTGFIIRQLFGGAEIPVIPVLQNTYYPPCVMRPDRCYQVGQAIRKAIEAIPSNERVAIVASGGLSHFVTSEALDRKVLDAIEQKDAATLRNIPMAALQSGNSEILCWITAAGATEHLDFAWSEYIPVYRTPAGTGIGLGFLAQRAR